MVGRGDPNRIHSAFRPESAFHDNVDGAFRSVCAAAYQSLFLHSDRFDGIAANSR